MFIGDIVGEPGRKAVALVLPYFKKTENIDFVIANAENSAGGAGFTPNVSQELFTVGVDVVTLGNHTWQRKEIKDIIESSRVIRPANYPPNTPGKGYNIYYVGDKKVAVINLMGRVYMLHLDCPFRCMNSVLESVRKETNIIVVDMHAEITSEKQAMGWFLDGKVSAMIGTHTHVPTADERVLPEGTAYITDCGMTGPRDSVIGVEKELVLKKYLTQIPVHFEVAKNDVVLQGVVVDIDDKTGKAKSIVRVCHCLGDV